MPTGRAVDARTRTAGATRSPARTGEPPLGAGPRARGIPPRIGIVIKDALERAKLLAG